MPTSLHAAEIAVTAFEGDRTGLRSERGQAPASIIDGKACAMALRARVADGARTFVAACGRAPGLAVILVGADPASGFYGQSKGNATREAGMLSFEHRLPEDATAEDLLKLLKVLNADPGVDGILVQLPLPRHIDEWAVIAAIDPGKDVDGFHVVNVGRLVIGEEGFVPCTQSLLRILAEQGSLSIADAYASLDACLVPESSVDEWRVTCTERDLHSRGLEAWAEAAPGLGG